MKEEISTQLFNLVYPNSESHNSPLQEWQENFRVLTDMDNIFKDMVTVQDFTNWINSTTTYDFKIRFYYGMKEVTNINNKRLNTSVENHYTVKEKDSKLILTEKNEITDSGYVSDNSINCDQINNISQPSSGNLIGVKKFSNCSNF